MALFLTMLPVYLLGNIHCLGMCGPLVAMLGNHPYRFFYFVGRTFAFSMAAMLAAEGGAVLQILLKKWQISALFPLLFGGAIVVIGFSMAAEQSLPFAKSFMAFINKKLAPLNQKISLLLLKESPLSAFLFGCSTLLLPCGQSLLVFSACALTNDAWIGLANGLAFALLTSPSLLLAMQAPLLLRIARGHYQKIIALSAITVGALASLRGAAEFGWINHLTVYSQEPYHIVIY